MVKNIALKVILLIAVIFVVIGGVLGVATAQRISQQAQIKGLSKITQQIIPPKSIVVNPTLQSKQQLPVAAQFGCYDSDKGLNYSVKGYVEQFQKRTYDECMLFVPLFSTPRDWRAKELQPGEHTGKIYTTVNERYCDKRLGDKMPTMYTKEYDCSGEGKSCYDGACYTPACEVRGKGVTYTGLALESNSMGYREETTAFTKRCKDSRTLTDYRCDTYGASNKYKILDPAVYSHKYLVNSGQPYPTKNERRCGSTRLRAPCPVLGVRPSIEISGCLEGADYAVCADDLGGMSREERERFCNQRPSRGGAGGPEPSQQPPEAQPTENTGTAGCTDSDGGPDGYHQGTVEIHQNDTVTESHTDYCVGKDRVKEWYCHGGDKGFRRIECSLACSQGACVS